MKVEDLKKTVCRELERFPDKGDISVGELDILYKLVITKEKLLRIEEIEQHLGKSGEQNYGYGNSGGYGQMGGYGNYGNETGGYGYGPRTWTAEGNYGSGGQAKRKIQELMEDRSVSPHEREILRKAMEQM